MSARKVLNLIDKLPDTGVFAAHLAAKPPSSGPKQEPPAWRRFHGWGTDRMLRHAAVQVHVDKKNAKKWASVAPTQGEQMQRVDWGG